ncbi:hypothetical protein BH10BAC3_BH10BAC3_16800 [soil metagenome]
MLMKNYALFFIVILCSFTPFTDNTVDRLGVKGPLVFGDTNFKLTWTDKPNDTYYIQEYLPAGDTLEKFKQLLTIHLYEKDITTQDAVKQKIQELVKRRLTDPICNYKVIESPDGKEFMVDFLLSESKNDLMEIVEFNIYHYKQVELGGNKKAILVYAYSKRSYGDEITPFLKHLKTERMEMLNTMIAAQVPVITLIEN